jgi:hypothetical protein
MSKSHQILLSMRLQSFLDYEINIDNAEGSEG